MVCGNGKFESEEDTFSPVPDFTVIKLVMYIAKQRGYLRRHFDFQNAFPNGKLDRMVYAELQKTIFGDELRANKVMRLKRSLYGLKDAAHIWYELLKSQFAEAVLVKLKSAPCVFKFEKTILICYVDDLLVSFRNMSDILKLKHKLGRVLFSKI